MNFDRLSRKDVILIWTHHSISWTLFLHILQHFHVCWWPLTTFVKNLFHGRWQFFIVFHLNLLGMKAIHWQHMTWVDGVWQLFLSTLRTQSVRIPVNMIAFMGMIKHFQLISSVYKSSCHHFSTLFISYLLFNSIRAISFPLQMSQTCDRRNNVYMEMMYCSVITFSLDKR